MNYTSHLGAITIAQEERSARKESSVSSKALRSMFKLWRERRVERLALKKLSPRLLQDIGLSENARNLEVRKPFWKA